MRGNTLATDRTASPSRFQLWYQKNRKKLSKRRRERYKADPGYREQVLEHTRVYRTKARKKAKPRPGFSVTEAAVRIGRTAQTIREWEKRKLIPKTRDDRGYRRYTSQQVGLLRVLGKTLDDHRYHRVTSDKVAAVRASVKANWNAGKVR